MQRMIRVIATIAASLLLASCGGIMGPVKTPPMHTYTLQYHSYPNPVGRNKPVTLMLTTPTASPGYQNKKMIYSCQPFELSSYIKNQWAGPPAEMLKPMLVQAIRDTGYFHAVISSPISADSNMRLKINVLEMRHDFTCRPSRVLLAIQATIVNDKDDQVIASQVFTEAVPAPCPNPYGGVIAANRAANTILRQIARFCIRNIVHPKIAKLPKSFLSTGKQTVSLPEPTIPTV